MERNFITCATVCLVNKTHTNTHTMKTIKFHVHTFIILLLLSTTQLDHSNGMEPATIHVDRNWEIPDSTRVGDIVKTVRLTGNVDASKINFTLEPDDPFNPNLDNPFWINPQSGFVYLNKSLEGRVSLKNVDPDLVKFRNLTLHFGYFHVVG